MTTIADLIAAVDNDEPFDPNQIITVTGSAHDWGNLDIAYYQALENAHVDFIEVEGGIFVLSLDKAKALASQSTALAEGCSLTVIVTAENIDDVLTGDIAGLADKGATAFTTEGDAALSLTAAQAAAIADEDIAFDDADTVTISDSAENIVALAADQLATLGANGIDIIHLTGEFGVSLNVAQAQSLALPTSNIVFTGDLTVAVFISEGSFPFSDVEIGRLGAAGVSFIGSTGTSISLTAAQAMALAESGILLNGGDAVTIADTADNIALISAGQITTLGDQGVDVISITDEGVVVWTPAQAAAFADSPIALGSGGVPVVAGGGFGNLTPEQITKLDEKGIGSFDASTPVTLGAAQALALSDTDIAFDADDIVTVAASSADMVGWQAGVFTALAANGVDTIDVSGDGILTLDFDQAFALSQTSITLADSDTLVVSATAIQISAAGVDVIESLAAKGLTAFTTDGAATFAISAAAAGAIATAGIGLDSDDTITVSGTGNAIAALSTNQIQALIDEGIAGFIVDGGTIALSMAQFELLEDLLDDGAAVTLADTTEALEALDPTAIAQLSGRGVVGLDSTDDHLTLTLAQYEALGENLALTEGDEITLSDVAADFVNLVAGQMENLVVRGIDVLRASDDVVLTVEQALTLAASGLKYSTASIVKVQGSSDALMALQAADFTSLGSKGVDTIVVADDDGVLILSVDQAIALAESGLGSIDGDNVIVQGETAAIAGFSAEQITKLGQKGVDKFDVTDMDGILPLSVEKALAFAGTGITLANGDSVIVTDTASNLADLTAAQYTLLSGKGIELLDATEAVNLTVAQAVLLADSELGYVVDDMVTIAVAEAAEIALLTPERLQDLGAKGIGHIASDVNLTLTIDQAKKLAATAIDFTGTGTITVQASGAAIAGLSTTEIDALVDAGVDGFDANGDAIVLTVAQLDLLVGKLVNTDGITLADEAAVIELIEADIMAMLAEIGVVAIDVTGDSMLTLSYAQFSALGAVALTSSDVITVTVSADDLATLDLGDMANKHVHVLDASEPVSLTADQAFDLISSPLAFTADNTVAIAVAEGNMPFDSDDFETLEEKGVDVIDVEGANGVLAFTVSQALGFAASGITLATGDTMKVVDTGAALAGLDQTQLNALLAKGFTLFDANDDAISLTVAKLNMFDGHLAAGDAVTLADGGNTIAGLDVDALANLDDMGVVAIDATDNALTLTVGQLEALHPDVALTAGDVVTLSGDADYFLGLDGDDLATLVDRGVDKLHATDAVTLTVAQAITLAASGLGYTAGSSVKIAGSSAAFNDLTIEQITLLGQKGIDVFDLTEGSLMVNAAKAAALAASGIAIAEGDTVALSDNGQNISGLSVTQIAALAAQGIASIDAMDNALSLTAAQFNALGTVTLTAADAVTLTDTGAALASLSATQIGQLAAKSIDALDASDNALALSVGQFNALGSVSLTVSDTVTLSDTGAALGALSAAQISALAGKGVDAVDASDNALSLSLAQFNALGTVGLMAADVVTLADTGASLGGLSTAQMAALGAKGVDVYNLTDNAITLTAAQMASLGSVDFAAGDRVTVNGTTGADRIAGKSSDDMIKGLAKNDVLSGGNGNDQLWGGTGKDVLTGNAGNDVFVFDAAPTKANVDQITDFSVADDTIWLDNKYLKKLGKGSAAKPGKLNKKVFKVADKAKDGNDYLVYNKKTGVLSYDEDGSGAKAAVQIAKLSKGLKLTADDFFVI
jgi:Ca2+-binding RTX toxin-like protein